jgi:hypothetical protein
MRKTVRLREIASRAGLRNNFYRGDAETRRKKTKMFNPYLLSCCSAIALPIWVMFVYYRITKQPIRWLRLFVISVPAGILLASGLWLLIYRYIPSQSTRLFETPVSQIQSIEINPTPLFSLVDQSLTITNETEIKEIMTAIRSAMPYSPNHPGTQWQCNLVISDSVGNSYLNLVNTPGLSQGTLLFCKTSPEGFIYNTLRSDTLGGILEKSIGPVAYK